MAPKSRVGGPEQGHKVEVEWTTVSYRTIAFYAVLGLVAVGFILYLIAPNYFALKARGALHALTAGVVENGAENVTPSKRAAHFVNLDGTVRVKKAQSPQWVQANYNTNLVTGDFIQTGSDGVARIIFADGTNYVIKPDSLIAVEESGEDPVTRATRVAVQVTSGTVDLSTGRFEVPGSTSRVAFADALANLGEESRAVVQNDPKRNIHQMTMDQGGARVTRGSTTVQLGQYEKVGFSANQPGLLRERVIAPPNLILPANMALNVVQNTRSTQIEFRWSAVEGARDYVLEISPSGMFSNLVVNRKVEGTSAEVSGLDEGVYYWLVKSIDGNGNESQPSMASRFDVVQQISENHQAFLEITNIVQHGRVVEVVGRAEPGSTVIINNQQVFNIAADGTFRHFTSPLPRKGSNQVTITAQDRKGNTKTIRKTVVIEQ
ncbi:MAG: hypothetical protein EPN47_11735 [Acidobacteria bacterium]|nr:MAG: hypothetical protein EPN47_11735 [Acidobacteriota bacterium]